VTSRGRPAGVTRFLGVDLAWRRENPSGIAILAGPAFPLRLVAPPRTLATHADVLAWLDAEARQHPVAVGIDAPLLGLDRRRRRRPCDDAVACAFGRFHASTHTPPAAPDLAAFVDRLRRALGALGASPRHAPVRGRPAVREVYPNALQVLLFALDRRPRATILPYKRRRFRTKAAWVREGLRPFVKACRRALEGRYVDPRAAAWRGLVARRPSPAMPTAELKAIEDGWDAVLCALAVALAELAPGTMRAYGASGRDGWRRGFILAPTLPTAGPPSPPPARRAFPGARRGAGFPGSGPLAIRVDRASARA
jgi:predicted RNase H-like nuclease